MKLSKKTYRFFSAFTLILFLSSVLLPATLSAAGLFCGMQESAQEDHNALACWKMNSIDHADGLSETSACPFQEVCEYAVADDQRTAEAIPQFTKSFAVAFVLTKISSGDTAATQHRPPQSEVTIPTNEPLFLLNSSFLN